MPLTPRMLLCCATMLLLVQTAAAAESLRIKVETGQIEGKMSDDGRVRVFLGIPFAAPPIGPLRWKPPQPALKWSDTLETQSFGARCMQPSVNADMVFHDPGQSEDCLTLNVWAPPASAGEKLPVMVWIFGGGFTTGSTSERRQDGAEFARRGVILVSMNYRLNIFGFFAHPGLAAESPEHAAGNYGLMDQAAAIQWVRRNIAQFGGDPKNITLFGESAGSFSVSAQMASPMAKDALAHAIGESGGAFSRSGLGFPPLAKEEKEGEEFARDVLGKNSLEELRAMPAEELMKAVMSQHAPGAIRFSPDVDGLFLPDSVPAIFAAGKQAHIPLLAGWNADEGIWTILGMKQKPTLASYQAMARKVYGERADDFLKAYAATDDAQAVRSWTDYAGDQFIAASTWEWIEAQVKTGDAPVYRYYFQRPSPGDAFHPATAGAFHSSEIEFVFGMLDTRKDAPWKPADYKLSSEMQSYWINFAKNGDPNGPGLPQWPAYSAADGWDVMHLDVDSKAMPDMTRDRYMFLRSWKPAAASSTSN